MKALLNWRYHVLTYISVIVMFLFFSEPTNEESWLVVFSITRVCRFVGLYIILRLFQHWETKGLIPELSAMLND